MRKPGNSKGLVWKNIEGQGLKQNIKFPDKECVHLTVSKGNIKKGFCTVLYIKVKLKLYNSVKTSDELIQVIQLNLGVMDSKLG